jgi:hypothetical protein
MDRESMMPGMSEHEEAAELQATKDDAEEWGDAVPAPAASREKRRLAAMVSVRLSPEELESLQRHVQRLDLTVSGFLRHLALDAIAPRGNVMALATFPTASSGHSQTYRMTSSVIHAQMGGVPA